MTDGFSGSDLKSFCVAAGYQPIREFLEKEKNKPQEEEKKEEKAEDAMDLEDEEEEKEKPAAHLRAIRLGDFKKAKEEISASTSEDGQAIAELRKWNDLYGEGGSRKKTTLSYFV